jgi:hypothetical protein
MLWVGLRDWWKRQTFIQRLSVWGIVGLVIAWLWLAELTSPLTALRPTLESGTLAPLWPSSPATLSKSALRTIIHAQENRIPGATRSAPEFGTLTPPVFPLLRQSLVGIAMNTGYRQAFETINESLRTTF